MGGARPGCAGRSQVRTWAAILVETMLPLPAGEAPELPPPTTEPLCPLVTTMHCGGHQVGYMFLGEVALGKEHHITIDDPSLKSPPSGFDSVIARGQTEPGEPQILGRSTAERGVGMRGWRNLQEDVSIESRL